MCVYSDFDVDCLIFPGADDFKAQQHGEVGKAATSPRSQGPCSKSGGKMGRGRIKRGVRERWEEGKGEIRRGTVRRGVRGSCEEGNEDGGGGGGLRKRRKALLPDSVNQEVQKM